MTLNNNPKLQELFLSPSPRSEVVVYIFLSINEFLYMITLPALNACFKNLETRKFKATLVSITDNRIVKPRSPLVKIFLVCLQQLLGLKAVVHLSFAEYHRKRNPVERVHMVH